MVFFMLLILWVENIFKKEAATEKGDIDFEIQKWVEALPHSCIGG